MNTKTWRKACDDFDRLIKLLVRLNILKEEPRLMYVVFDRYVNDHYKYKILGK